MSNETKSIFSNARQYLNDLNPSAVSDGRSVVGSSKKASTLRRFDSFYNFELVIFEVDGTLFQVIKNGFLVPGTIFETMFTLPHKLGSLDTPAVKGNSPENPIHLADVSATEFRFFLGILYPVFDAPLFGILPWISVLKLSTMWNFRQIRKKAISALSTKLQDMSASEKASLGRAYRVPKWLRAGYMELAQKPDLRLEELRANRLGVSLDWETIAKIAFLRQEVLLDMYSVNGHQKYCHTCEVYYGTRQDQILDCNCRLPAVIDSLFKDDLRSAEEGSS